MKEKQIEEMAKDLRESDTCKRLPESICDRRSCSLCQAEILYELGYRKQSEGEWVFRGDGAYGRAIVSENGFHSVCCFSQKKAMDCFMGKKDYFVPRTPKERGDSDG